MATPRKKVSSLTREQKNILVDLINTHKVVLGKSGFGSPCEREPSSGQGKIPTNGTTKPRNQN